MEKEEVEVFIWGTSFLRDTVNGLLVERDNPRNVIDLTTLNNDGSKFDMAYDINRHNVYTGAAGIGDASSHVKYVQLPVELLDAEFDARSIKDFNKVSALKNFGILLADHKTAERMRGVLPRIDLAGSPFLVSWKSKVIRAEDNIFNRIDLTKLPPSASGESYYCYFDTIKKQGILPGSDADKTGKGVVMLEIPHQNTLDPIAVAWEKDISEAAMLSQYPVQEDLKARVLPPAERQRIEKWLNPPKVALSNEGPKGKNSKTVKKQKGKKF